MKKIIQIVAPAVDQLFALTDTGEVYVFNKGWDKLPELPVELFVEKSGFKIEDIAK